jgi:hypothetical protein
MKEKTSGSTHLLQFLFLIRLFSFFMASGSFFNVSASESLCCLFPAPDAPSSLFSALIYRVLTGVHMGSNQVLPAFFAKFTLSLAPVFLMVVFLLSKVLLYYQRRKAHGVYP